MELLNIEEWRKIIINGIKTNYSISNTGYVRNDITDLILKPFISNSGYYRVRLSVPGMKVRKNYSVHRLLSIAFIPIPQKYIDKGLSYDTLVPNHKDGNKLNTTVWNLEWTTVKDNTIHAVENTLTSAIGETCHLAKMTEKTAIECCELLQAGWTSGDIAEKLGISKKSVVHIKAGECWKHISKNYNFPKKGSKPYSIESEKIHKVCKLLEEKKYSDYEIGQKVSLSRETIRDIRCHKRRKDISKNYNF